MIEGWHFCRDGRLRDGRPVVIGEWLQHVGPLKLCERGYHASKRLIDALNYAHGWTICRVEVDGEIHQDADKLVARRRRCTAMIDGEAILRAFARWCALQVIHVWDAPEIVRRYLETGDETIRDAARHAARNATCAAAMEARDAARAAARAAARDATWAAAGDATWAAATAATARVAADEAAATWPATWPAAWAAARDKQDAELTRLVTAAMEVQP
jgi:hypothetical protein